MEEVLGLVHEKKTLQHIYALLSLSFESLPLISPSIYELPHLYDALAFCNNLFASIQAAHAHESALVVEDVAGNSMNSRNTSGLKKGKTSSSGALSDQDTS